jgi:hypothetical protein
MSRIILTNYDDNNQHVVVGWDRPLATYYWQEFNKEPEPNQDGDIIWEEFPDWQEVLDFKGYVPNELPTIDEFLKSLSKYMRPLVNDRAIAMLTEHSMQDEQQNKVFDLTESWRAEVVADGTRQWYSNNVRFATSKEAKEYAEDLKNRWLAVTELRIIKCPDPVNYEWKNGRAVDIGGSAKS